MSRNLPNTAVNVVAAMFVIGLLNGCESGGFSAQTPGTAIQASSLPTVTNPTPTPTPKPTPQTTPHPQPTPASTPIPPPLPTSGFTAELNAVSLRKTSFT